MNSGPNAEPRPPARCLVTGGAGFIGSHLVERLLAQGCDVTVVDDLSTGRRENLAASPRARLIVSELSRALPALTDEPAFDEIYHLAAAVGVRRIIERPIESIETNVHETAALLRFASAGRARRGGDGPAVLVASSSEVYGKSARSPFCEDDDCVIGPTVALRWSYACSKAIDEHLALAHHQQTGLRVTVARFFNTVGPRQVGDYGMVLPSFVSRVLAGRPPEVYGDGGQSRCFCDVRDVAPALPRMVRTPRCWGRVFNVGSDEPISILELARLVCRTLGKPMEPAIISYDRAYAPGFEDLRQRRPDLGRIREAIGFEPRIRLEETIRDIARGMGWRQADE
ncbi:MAG: GDP-mannose 4,6-dehydratase [Planctomycetota bacterium]|nr:GDP-mannose 4,6-dehydratase [Planctomycetota bacterium]